MLTCGDCGFADESEDPFDEGTDPDTGETILVCPECGGTDVMRDAPDDDDEDFDDDDLDESPDEEEDDDDWDDEEEDDDDWDEDDDRW